MKRGAWALLALALASLPARGDLVVLADGTQVHGTATWQGDTLVLRQALGEARYAREQVSSVTTDRELTERAEAAKRAWEAERERWAREAGVQDLPPEKALRWEPDAAEAARQARESDRLLLTFLVVGELGTGRC